jgi:hypothetical protein
MALVVKVLMDRMMVTSVKSTEKTQQAEGCTGKNI